MSSSERTEKATPKRRGEAQRKGQVAKSVEVSNLFALTGGFFMIWLTAGRMLHTFEASMRQMFQRLASPELAGGGLSVALSDAMRTLLTLTVPIFAVAAGMAVAASVSQNRPMLTTYALKPDLKRLNPVAGLKKLASPHSLVDLVKSLVKLGAVGGMAFLTVYPRLHDLAAMGNV